MYRTFEKQLEKYHLLSTDKKIVLAISGGVDSMVLFHLIQRIPKKKRPTVFIAHVNHGLRVESKEEEGFVRRVAEECQVSLSVHLWKPSEHPHTGIEEAARNMRYAFFKEVAEQTKADAVMTAHHQDDQVETILMKLTRGSGLEQLTGIKDAQPFYESLLVRPLLPFSKNKIYHYADAEQIEYMEDPSNQELTYSRNRFRNQLIPLLKEENPKFNQHIEQFAMDLNDLINIAKEPIQNAFAKLVNIQPTQLTFNLKTYLQFTEPMQRAVLVEIMETLYKNQTNRYKISYLAIIQKWLKQTKGNSQLDLADDITIQKAYDHITFQKNRVLSQTVDDTQQQTSYIIDRDHPFVELSAGESIKLEIIDSAHGDLEAVEQTKGTNQLVFQSDQVQFPLTIRHRQPGDKMTYQGLQGTKKIKDIFIDEKVPASHRDEAWLVEDATGTILWLISYRKMYLLSEKETDKLTYILHYHKHKN